MKCPRCDVEMQKQEPQTTSAEGDRFRCGCCGTSAHRAIHTTFLYINNDMSATSHYFCGHPYHPTSIEIIPTHETL